MQVHLSRSPVAGGEQEEYVIFGRTAQRAQLLAIIFWQKRDDLPVAWSGDEYEKFTLFGKHEQLLEALRRDQEGLGTFDELSGWTIIPATPEDMAEWTIYRAPDDDVR